MAAEVKAQRLLLVRQLLDHRPGRRIHHGVGPAFRAAVVHGVEQAVLVNVAVFLLRRFHRHADARQQARPVGVEGVECAGAHQGLDHAAVDGAFVHPSAEVEQAGERPVFFTRYDDDVDRRLAGALDRAQAVADFRPGNRLETVAGNIHIRRQHHHLVGQGVLVEHLELVGIIQFRGQRRRHEGRGVVRLEPGGLVGNHRVGGGVGLVEAVFGELRHQVEQAVGELFRVIFLERALDEQAAVLVHLLLILLAHCAPQQVRPAQGVAADDLGNLHHLFLVDDHAVGWGEAGLQVRMEIVDGLLALLAQDEIVHHAGTQRPWPVQREHGDDVLEAVGLELGQQLLHALRFKLEHRRGIGLLQHLVGRRIVEMLGVQGLIEARVELFDVLEGELDDGQVAQAEKVELDQADRLHVVLVELADRVVRIRREIQRAKIGQLAGRDQHAAGVHTDVARQPFELARQDEQLAHLFLAVVALLELGLHRQRLVQRILLAGRGGNQLG